MTDSSGQIHLNQANIDELQKLKGIGEKKGSGNCGIPSKEWWL